MWCTNCGQKLMEGARFCDRCGATQTPPVVNQLITNQPVGVFTPPVPPTQAGAATRPLVSAKIVLNEQQIDLPLDRSFTIGRGDGVNIVDLDLTAIDTQLFSSRKHAEIVARFGDYFVKDLGSRNGTYINEKKIGVNEEVKLNHQDRIILGQIELIFHYGA